MERSASGTFVLVDGTSSVVVDDRCWPIIFTTWFGEPTAPAVDKYFECHGRLIDRARRARERVVLVTDTFATERPAPIVRKRIVDRTAAQPADVQTIAMKSFIVVESALMRGVITALSWVDATMRESETVPSTTVAIERALATLDAADIARPAGLTATSYRRPKRP
jgi:hypothetical protein